MSNTDTPDPAAVYEAVNDAISEVLIDQNSLVTGISVALLTGGHVLIEGVPGVGKTLGAQSFARATGLNYGRIQMTPDVLPADITGTHVYRETTGEFELQEGPVFTNVVVADEINRATPKTQSALLEAMQENTVTIDGETRPLPTPFLVIATQNPIEYEGTFPLPEAQRDRFQLKLTVEPPDRDGEMKLLDRFDTTPELGADDITQVVETTDLLAARETVADVYVSTPVKSYILDLIAATRTSDELAHGASPRAALSVLDVAKAQAALNGRDYVIPDDVKSFATMVLSHRLVLGTSAELSDRNTRAILTDILEETPVPSASESFTPADESEATQ
jgi:MoxR-like ATPase